MLATLERHLLYGIFYILTLLDVFVVVAFIDNKKSIVLRTRDPPGDQAPLDAADLQQQEPEDLR